MTPRGFAALAAASGALVLAGWMIGGAGLDSAPVMDADAGRLPAAQKGALLGSPRAVAMTGHAAPFPQAASVDASLLSPNPILAPGDPSLQLAALGDPVHRFADDAIGSIQSAPALGAVKRAIVVPRLDKENLTVGHIRQLKASLDLTPEQERHWPPVEAELREIARQLAAQKASGKKVAIGATEAQRLYWSAGPLIMSLREDQKQEIRRIARAMGLDQIASLL